jgi:hypothetical protein
MFFSRTSPLCFTRHVSDRAIKTLLLYMPKLYYNSSESLAVICRSSVENKMYMYLIFNSNVLCFFDN